MTTVVEPVSYEDAHKFAERNQQRICLSLPPDLLSKEDRFLEKIIRAKVGSLKKLEMLYGLMDELSKATSKFTPCKKKCSDCCYYAVSVSDVEVAYIEKNTKHRCNKKLEPTRQFHGIPCPFLINGSCSIYNARPFVCRRHNTLTPNSYWCHHDRSDQPFPKLAFSNIDGAFDVIRLETNPGKPSDIRQLFA